MDHYAEMSQKADAHIREVYAGLIAKRRAEHTARAEAERQAASVKNAPSWARWRSERDLKALIDEVVASGQPPTDEHRATYAQLSKAAGHEGEK